MKNIVLISFLISNLVFSQKIHVKYFHVRSPVANVYEDLYIDGNKVISRQDSILKLSNFNNGSEVFSFKSNKTGKAFYFISNLMDKNKKNNDYFFTASLGNNNDYFIHDKITVPLWNIDDKTTKNILGYKCIKATTNFRGSSITAYFSPDLPYSAGPFKFFGLPGLILDVRVDNKSYDIWKAEKIEIDYKESVNFTPNFEGYSKIEIKDFIDLKENMSLKDNEKMLKNLPEGVNIQNSRNRLSVEKKFEWENN